MEITIKFDENDIATHTTDVVEAILQATNMKYDVQKEVAKNQETKQQEKKQEKKQAESEKQQEYTLDDIIDAANEKRKIIGRRKIIDLVDEKYGGQGVSGIKESDYGAFLKDLEELQ